MTTAELPAKSLDPAEQAAALHKTFAAQDIAFRHELLDLDADSKCRLPGFDCPACPPQGTTAA